MNRPTVLYLSYDGLCDPVGASQVLPYLKGLAKGGMRFFVISFEKNDRFLLGKSRIEQELENTEITWIPFSYTKNPPVLSTMLDLRKMKKMAFRICRENQIDFVHARSYIPALAAQSVFKKTNIPFLFDMRGFWADERIDGGIWSLRNPLYKAIFRYFKKKEKGLLQEAKNIVSLTFTAKEVMSKQWNVDEAKIHVIPCAADYEHFSRARSLTPSELLRKYNLKPVAGKTLLYTGSTGTWYMLEEMAEFYRVFRQHFPESRFLLCVNEVNAAVDKIRTQFPNEVTVLERVSRNDMPEVISLASYSIMFIKPAFSKQASSPIKLAESLAMGVPVICNAGVGDLGSVEDDGFGLIVADFTPEVFETVCRKILVTEFSHEKLRQQSAELYELNNNIEKYREIYAKM